MRQSILVAVGLLLAISAGCGDKTTPAASAPAPRAAVKLTLLIVDDPEIAAAAKLLRGEWAERSGGELVVEEMSLDAFERAEQLQADLVVYPSRLVGTLVARGWLRPVRESVLRADDFSYDDLFPAVRDLSMRYGDQVYSVSLGEPPLVVLWDGDVSSVPATWQRLDELMPPTDDAKSVVAELIARAAGGADPRYRAELLFDPSTFTPRLTTPPVVRALETIAARSKAADLPVTRSRIAWPTTNLLGGAGTWTAASLPRPTQVYDMLRQDWERETGGARLAVFGFAGRSASVTAASHNATSAFKLLSWLTSGEPALAVSSRSHATVWFRNSQVVRAQRWLEDRVGSEAVPVVTALLSSDDYFLLPRVPSIDRYLASLQEAVQSSMRGELSPVEALTKAAAEWEEITESLGRDAQRLAYRRHLGLVTIGN